MLTFFALIFIVAGIYGAIVSFIASWKDRS